MGLGAGAWVWINAHAHLESARDFNNSAQLIFHPDGKTTPEYIKIRENYDVLSTTLAVQVSPNDLANKLYGAQLIGEDLKRQANDEHVDCTERIGKMLAAVHNQIDLDCTMFQRFIEKLKEYTQLEGLLNRLRSKLHECHLATQ